MGFYEFFIIFICNTYLILFNVLTATADVDYTGPERVDEHSNFSITCNASLFSHIKWRLKETNRDFGVNKIDETRSDRFISSTLYVPSAKRTHTGTYKCSHQEDDFGHNLTVILDDSTYSYTLTLKSSENSQCPTPLSSNVNSTLQCAAGNLFDKFSLQCDANPKLENEHSIAWYQGSKNRSEKETLIETNERMTVANNNLTIKSLEINDARVYHCRIVKKGEERSGTQFIRQQSVEVIVKPRVLNTRREVTGIEENPINLSCVVTTSVPATVKWHVDNGILRNKTFEKNDNKYELSGNDSLLMDATFTIKSANITEDRGSYVCWAESAFGRTTTNMTFVLRVKSKYAALWPFLGICAEVVILCVIILIYEKKRDKTELEESDTDQGPETKSSPDHVQDNVRYRK